MAEDFNPILGKETGTYDPFRSVKDIPLIPIQEDEVFKPYVSNAENFLSFLAQLEEEIGPDIYPKGKSDKVAFKDRLFADLKEGVSKAGEIDYVKNLYGENNVFSDNEGNIVFRDEPGS